MPFIYSGKIVYIIPMKLADIEQKLEQHLATGAILTAQQVINILQHIEDLVTQYPSSLLL